MIEGENGHSCALLWPSSICPHIETHTLKHNFKTPTFLELVFWKPLGYLLVPQSSSWDVRSVFLSDIWVQLRNLEGDNVSGVIKREKGGPGRICHLEPHTAAMFLCVGCKQGFIRHPLDNGPRLQTDAPLPQVPTLFSQKPPCLCVYTIPAIRSKATFRK